MAVTATRGCSTVVFDTLFDDGAHGSKSSIGNTMMKDGHLLEHVGYVELASLHRPTKEIRQQPEGEFHYALYTHQPERCQFRLESSPLSSRSKQESHRSLWLSAAVVIGTLFAIAMVARFGGGMGMSTSSAKIFAGAAGAALGTYTLCALPLGFIVHRRAEARARLSYISTT